MFLLRAGHSGDPNGRGSRATQRSGASPCCGARRINVVDQNHVAATDRLRFGDKKSAANIRTALMRVKARLTCSLPPPYKQRRGKFDLYPGTALAQGAHHPASQQVRLVESTRSAFFPEQRNRYSKEIGRQPWDGQNLIRQQRSEGFCQGLDALIFKEVEQSPQLALINAVGDGLIEIRGRHATRAAESFAGRAWIALEGLATEGAKPARLCGQIVPAGRTNRQEGETNKRETANAAIGGENDGGKAVEGANHGTSKHANYRAPSRYMGWRNFGRQGKALTEDTPRFGGPCLRRPVSGVRILASRWVQYTGEARRRQYRTRQSLRRRYSGNRLQTRTGPAFSAG
jgi:hypothetical protein